MTPEARSELMQSVMVGLGLLTRTAERQSALGDSILRELDEAVWKIVEEYVPEDMQMVPR